jgi:hypothetical protein
MLRYIRSISVILILAIATSPAFAANCVTSCATKSIMTSISTGEMSNMPNCHKGSMDNEKSKSNIEHKSCSMGAGCNFSQAAPIDLSSKIVFIDLTSISFLQFNFSEKSADLSPPLKPPA